MALADVAVKSAGAVDPRAAAEAIPRSYNFAADILERNLAAGRAGKTVYIDPRGSWTYGQLAERVDRFGNVLRALGIRCEERVLLALLDTIDWPTAFLGAIKAGVVPIPVNTLMTEDDYRFMLADSRAKVLVVSEALFPKFANLIGASPDLMHVIVAGNNACGHRLFEDLLAQADARAATAATTRDDICFWLYTSGSTGRPKGAGHAHANLRLTADLYGDGVLGLKEADVCFSVAKLFFAYGLGNALTFPMAVGATTILSPYRPTPQGVAALLCRHAREPGRAPTRGREAEILHLRRRSPAARRWAALAGALRRRRARRHRLDRDAPHRHLELSRRGEIRHDRQTGAGLRHPPRGRRRQCDQNQRRDGRIAGPRAHRRDSLWDQPREDARDVFGGMDALRRQVCAGPGRLLRLLRPARRHAEARRPLWVALGG